ncbi:unnamed protein product, partial [Meganyctiphanes norvegica]
MLNLGRFVFDGSWKPGSFDAELVDSRELGSSVPSWLFSVIVFGCISSQGWTIDPKTKQERCLYNGDSNACNYGVGISVIAFLASLGFIAGEYLFEQMSSIKTRKHYVMADLGFSGFWSFLYFVGFCYLANQWSNTSPTPEYGVNNMQAAIAFSFFAIFPWAASAYLAFLRFKQGNAQEFAPSYEADPTNMAGYNSYPDATDPDGGYSQPPFNQQPMDTGAPVMQQAPPY